MKRLIFSLITIIALGIPALSQAVTWKIDLEHSYVGFQVQHLMIANVYGAFSTFNGVVTLDDNDITKSTVTVTIDTNSINTNVAKRDEHLRSADFFNVAQYPTMTFVSQKIIKGDKDTLQIIGNLTLHGVTRQVVLNARVPEKTSKDPWGNIRRGATASANINRKDFGLLWNAVLETGGIAVGNDITITLDVELIKQVNK